MVCSILLVEIDDDFEAVYWCEVLLSSFIDVIPLPTLPTSLFFSSQFESALWLRLLSVRTIGVGLRDCARSEMKFYEIARFEYRPFWPKVPIQSEGPCTVLCF